MFMGVRRRLVSVFRVTVAMSHFPMFVLMDMQVFLHMRMCVMPLVMGVFVSVRRRLVGVFRVTVAMAHFLMGMLMFMRLFFAHV
jgi:hypothetical protein